MMCGIVFSGNTKQIILTPEDDNEKVILDIIKDNTQYLRIKAGQFGVGRDDLVHQYSAGYSRQYNSLFIIMEPSDAKSE